MAKKDVEKAVKNLLRKSKKPLYQDDIADKIGINIFDVIKITKRLEKKGEIVLI